MGSIIFFTIKADRKTDFPLPVSRKYNIVISHFCVFHLVLCPSTGTGKNNQEPMSPQQLMDYYKNKDKRLLFVCVDALATGSQTRNNKLYENILVLGTVANSIVCAQNSQNLQPSN